MSGPSVGAKDHSGISNEELAEIMDIPCCTSMSHSGLSDEIAKRLRKYAELLSQVENADDRATDWGTNTGHGHVWKRPDGLMVRCGGPSICTICARDEKQPKPPIPATQDAQGGRFLPNGTRVIWQSSNGTEFPATITAWHAETYDAVLDDGCDAKGFARGRFKLPANARRAEGGECKLLSDLVRTAPDAIYLQVSDEAWHSEKEFPRDHDGISWCEDSVLACEVKYIRADLAIGESHEG